MTGYSGEFVRSDMLIPGVSFIQKPFTPADLRRKIRKMLADKPASQKGRSRQRRLTKNHVGDDHEPRGAAALGCPAERSSAILPARRSLSSCARLDSRGRLSPPGSSGILCIRGWHSAAALPTCLESNVRPYCSTWTAS